MQVVIDGYSSVLLNTVVPESFFLFPFLSLVFINDLLYVTRNPVYSFAGDSALCHSYIFSKRPCSCKIQKKYCELNDTPHKISFNTAKIQNCFVIRRRIAGEESATLNVDNENTKRFLLGRICIRSIGRSSQELKFFKAMQNKILYNSQYRYNLCHLYPCIIRVHLACVERNLQALLGDPQRHTEKRSDTHD